MLDPMQASRPAFPIALPWRLGRFDPLHSRISRPRLGVGAIEMFCRSHPSRPDMSNGAGAFPPLLTVAITPPGETKIVIERQFTGDKRPDTICGQDLVFALILLP